MRNPSPQPGVMLYFDVREAITQLSWEEKGMLFDAILDYGQYQTEPAFEGKALALIWPFVRKDILRDAQRYEARRQAGLRGAQRRWDSQESQVSDSKPMANDGKPMANDDKPMAKMPSTTPPSSPAAPSAPAAPPAAAAAPPFPAAAAAPEAPPPPPPSSLPRTNGSSLPDIAAQFLPARPTAPEEMLRRKEEALARLRALPPEE